MVTLTDIRGNDINVGDTVVYPRASGRSVEITEGEVVDIRISGYTEHFHWQPSWPEFIDASGGHDKADHSKWFFTRQRIDEPDTPEYSVKIKPIRSTRGFYRSDEQRLVTIKNWTNIVRVD